MRHDIIIIGAGAVGACIARELSRYNKNVLLLDKENDVGNVTSMANSAILHSGYDPIPNTNKAKFNVLGNKMFDLISDELDVHIERIGSLTVALYDEQLKVLEDLKKRSEENGVEVKILTKEEVLEMEPNINPDVKGALFAPTAGIIDPFNYVAHTVENALDNGVKLALNEEIVDIKKDGDLFILTSKKGHTFEAEIVINAAGLGAEKIARMLAPVDWTLTPRKGEYYVLDHYQEGLVNHVIFPLPSEKGKGILVSKTTSNNYIVGPSSELVDDVNDTSTDSETLANVKSQALDMVPSIPFYQSIRAFAGVRATCSRHDFVIEPSSVSPKFINLGGIESPGLVSSPAIGKYVVEELVSKLTKLDKNPNFNPRIKPYLRPTKTKMDVQERNELVKQNPDYGKMVCFCEQVSVAEIKDVLSRSVPVNSIKAIKKRTRAGFGKCQGGFCQPNVLALIAKELHLDWLDINFDDEQTNILVEKVK